MPERSASRRPRTLLLLREFALSVVEFVHHGARVVVNVELADLHVCVESRHGRAYDLDAFVRWRVSVEFSLVVGPMTPRERHRRRTYNGTVGIGIKVSE